MWTVQKVSLRWRNGIQMHHLNLTAQSTLGGVGFPIFPEVSSAVLFGCNWCLYLLVCHFVTACPGLLGKGFLSADVWTILKSNVSFQNGNYLLPTLEKWTWALTFFSIVKSLVLELLTQIGIVFHIPLQFHIFFLVSRYNLKNVLILI